MVIASRDASHPELYRMSKDLAATQVPPDQGPIGGDGPTSCHRLIGRQFG